MEIGSAAHLGVNIDHVATLRQLRGTAYPPLVKIAREVLATGAHQITVHLREDRRHIQDHDVVELRKQIRAPHLLNLEMAPEKAILAIAKRIKPDWVCLVPEKRQELTTEGGLDLKKAAPRVLEVVKAFKKTSTQVSLFIEPTLDMVNRAHALGAQAVEFHTGSFCLARGTKRSKIRNAIEASARRAVELGLRAHAGHGLDTDSVRELLDIREITEFNIGHSIVCRAVEVGMRAAVKEMLSAIVAP